MRFLSCATLLAASLAVHGSPTTRRDAVMSADVISTKAVEGMSLLQFAQDAEPEWHTEDEKLQFLRDGVHFVCRVLFLCVRLVT